jgi:hypothetical protein
MLVGPDGDVVEGEGRRHPPALLAQPWAYLVRRLGAASDRG